MGLHHTGMHGRAISRPSRLLRRSASGKRGTILCFWVGLFQAKVYKSHEGEIRVNVTEAILRKRAVRSYAPRPLPEDVVHTILRAGRRAQSSKNTQPWQFIALQKRETHEEISNMCDFANWLTDANMFGINLTLNIKLLWS